MRARPLLLLAAAGALWAARSPAAEKKEEPKARILVIKVWASAEAPKDQKKKDEGPEELKDLRKRLEEATGKRHFAIDGKFSIEDTTPGKASTFPLDEDRRLRITPMLEGKGEETKTVLQVSFIEKDADKKKDVEKKKFKVQMRVLPAIYCTPIRAQGRELVLIFRKT